MSINTLVILVYQCDRRISINIPVTNQSAELQWELKSL